MLLFLGCGDRRRYSTDLQMDLLTVHLLISCRRYSTSADKWPVNRSAERKSINSLNQNQNDFAICGGFRGPRFHLPAICRDLRLFSACVRTYIIDIGLFLLVSRVAGVAAAKLTHLSHARAFDLPAHLLSIVGQGPCTSPGAGTQRAAMEWLLSERLAIAEALDCVEQAAAVDYSVRLDGPSEEFELPSNGDWP